MSGADDSLTERLRPLTDRLSLSGRPRVVHRTGSLALPERDDPTWYVIGLAFVLFLGFSLYSIVLYYSFWQGGTDFGAYVHSLATTLDGEGWLLQGKYRANHPGDSYWGAHFSLTLLFYLIPFALVPSPLTLLVAKSAVVAASIPLLWVLARRQIGNDRVAGLVTVSYALNPFLWGAWIFDFQEQSLIPLFVFGAYYAYLRRWHKTFLVLFTLTLLTNEFEVFIGAGFLLGLAVVAAREGRLREERTVFAVGAAVVVAAQVLVTVVISRFSVTSGIPLKNVADPLLPYVTEGDTQTRTSVRALVETVLSRPSLFVESLTTHFRRKTIFLLLFFAPVLFAALSSVVVLASIAPYFGTAWVLTDIGAYQTFAAHYPFYVIPYVYIGTARVFGRTEWTADSARVLTRLFAVVILVGAAGSIGGDVGYRFSVEPEMDQEHTETLEAAIDSVPEEASLLTQNAIYPHVATRPRAKFVANENFDDYIRQYGLPNPEYILIDRTIDDHYNTRSNVAGRVLDSFGEQIGTKYGLYRVQSGIAVYKRGYGGPPRGITEPYRVPTRQYATTDFLLNQQHGERRGGVIAGTGDEKAPVWYGPYDTLPPGRYTAVFRVNVERTTLRGSGPTARLDVVAGEDHERVGVERVTSTDGWENVTVEFTLAERQEKVEFRGFHGPAAGTVQLRGVTVRQNATRRANRTALRPQSTRVPR